MGPVKIVYLFFVPIICSPTPSRFGAMLHVPRSHAFPEILIRELTACSRLSVTLRVLTHSNNTSIWHPIQQEYADESDAQLVHDGFSEHELAHKIYKYGNVATVFSSYEVSVARTGQLYSRGVNVYELYYAGNRWWISSVSWGAENNINPIPQELMRKN
jgi:hypothetical protein